MSSDLINREALKEAMWSLVINENDDIPILNVIETIDNAQAVDISGNEYFPYRTAYFNGVRDGRATAIPKGEWVNHRNDYGHNIADCSLCGKTMQWHDEDKDGIPRYCWYCGAKMKGGAE